MRRRCWRSASGRVIIGIAGKPGAGKSTLALALVAALAGSVDWIGTRVAYLPMDGFHLADVELARLGLLDAKGTPQTFDPGGYAALLRRVRDGESVWAPAFERTVEQPIAQSLPITEATKIVITEGNYLLLPDPPWRRAREQLTEAWYAQLHDETRVRRLVWRHVEFGKTPLGARAWVDRNDEPNAELIGRYADTRRPRRSIHGLERARNEPCAVCRRELEYGAFWTGQSLASSRTVRLGGQRCSRSARLRCTTSMSVITVLGCALLMGCSSSTSPTTSSTPPRRRRLRRHRTRRCSSSVDRRQSLLRHRARARCVDRELRLVFGSHAGRGGCRTRPIGELPACWAMPPSRAASPICLLRPVGTNTAHTECGADRFRSSGCRAGGRCAHLRTTTTSRRCTPSRWPGLATRRTTTGLPR